MNEEATPANTSSALGTREICARINENNTLDADEDVVDGVKLDVTALAIPAYHDSGTPGDSSDDTGGITGHQFEFNYSSANLTVQAFEYDNPAVNILRRNVGSTISLGSDTAPDDNADNVWSHGAIDVGSGQPEDGSGVLTRITLETETGAVSGTYPVTLGNNAHVDAPGSAYIPTRTENAFVAVNSVCDVDADTVPDVQDACPQLAGPPSNAGCPPPGPPAVGGTVGLVEAERAALSAGGDGSTPSPYLLLSATLIAVTAAAGAGWAGMRWAKQRARR